MDSGIRVSVALDAAERLAVVRMQGVVSGPMILAATTQVHSDPAWEDGFDVVWDCSTVYAHDILPADVTPIVDAEVGSGDGRDVLVCSPAIGDRVISEMLAAMCRRRGKAMTVHASFAEALATLGRDALPASLQGL